MLHENLQRLRKAKGLSQEELAVKLNVVRQTVSKWEKGLSVPDAQMLLDIAEALDTTVNVLLGEQVAPEEESEIKVLAKKLELLNEQFARQNENRRKIWKAIFWILCVAAVLAFSAELAAFLYAQAAMGSIHGDLAIIGGADGPTQIMVSVGPVHIPILLFTAAVAILSGIGLYRTGKHK